MFSAALKFLLDRVALPAAFTAAGAAFTPFGFLLGLPFIGDWIRAGIQKIFDDLLDKGIIEVKVEILDNLNEKAEVEYAPQITILREAQANPELTPEQEKEYAEKLDELIRHRPGVVNG